MYKIKLGSSRYSAVLVEALEFVCISISVSVSVSVYSKTALCYVQKEGCEVLNKFVIYFFYIAGPTPDPCSVCERGHRCETDESSGTVYCEPDCSMDPCPPGYTCLVETVFCGDRSPCPSVLTCAGTSESIMHV